MRSTVEPLEGNKVKLSVEVDEREFDKAIDAAFRKIAREVRIPGFRPGKAPRRILEARLGAEVGREEALRDALPEYYVEAVKEHEVDVIAAPEIDITAGQEDGPVAFDAVVEVRPRVDVPGYGGLRVELPEPDATDEEIDAQVDRLREQFAELAEVDRPAADGDDVTISHQRRARTARPSPASRPTTTPTRSAAARIAAELDEQLEGAKRRRHPRRSTAELAGTDDATVAFQVLVEGGEGEGPARGHRRVGQRGVGVRHGRRAAGRHRRPPRHGSAGCRPDGAAREGGRGARPSWSTRSPRGARRSRDAAPGCSDLAMRLQAQGMTVEQYLAATGRDQEQLVDELRETAAQAVKADLALRAVADAEAIEATDDDLDAEIERAGRAARAEARQGPPPVRAHDQIPAVRSDLRKRKALEWLVEHVEIVDEEGKPIERADLEVR